MNQVMKKLLPVFRRFRGAILCISAGFFITSAASAQCCYDAYGLYQLIDSWEEGGIEVKLTGVKNETVPVYGIRGGWWISDQKALFGITGNFGIGSWSELSGQRTRAEIAYGGIYLDINHDPYRPFHLNSNITLGYGVAEISGPEVTQNGSTAFLLIEPNLNVKVRLASWCKFVIGGGYRFARGTGSRYLDGNDLSAPLINFGLMFGDYGSYDSPY